MALYIVSNNNLTLLARSYVRGFDMTFSLIGSCMACDTHAVPDDVV